MGTLNEMRQEFRHQQYGSGHHRGCAGDQGDQHGGCAGDQGDQGCQVFKHQECSSGHQGECIDNGVVDIVEKAPKFGVKCVYEQADIQLLK